MCEKGFLEPLEVLGFCSTKKVENHCPKQYISYRHISIFKILKPQMLTFLKLFFTDPKYDYFCKISDPKY